MQIIEDRKIKKTIVLNRTDIIDIWNQANPKNRAPENAKVYECGFAQDDIFEIYLEWTEGN